MVSEKMLQLGRHRSVIRDIFEYGTMRKEQRRKEEIYGTENQGFVVC